MIYIIKDIYKAENNLSVPFTGPLIDFLLLHYPNGFKDNTSIILNGEVLPVVDYDKELGEDDICAIATVPGTPLQIAQIVIGIIIATLQVVLLSQKPKNKNRGTRGRVFDIGSGQNVPALGQVITEHFGKTWFYPDVASQPYVFNLANDQYVHQILLVGAGDYQINDIKFGNTELNLIPPDLIEYRVFTPADHKSQYGIIQSEFNVYEDVITSVDVQGLSLARNTVTSWAGQAPNDAGNGMLGAEYPNGFKAGDVMTFIGQPGWAMHNAVKTIVSIGNDGKMFFNSLVADNHWYQLIKDYNGEWRGWFTACPVDKTTDRIDLDFEFPNGLCYTTNEGGIKNASCYIELQLQQIDNDGVDVGAPIIKNIVYTANTRDPQRYTYTNSVPPGRYKVRVRRTNSDDIVTQVVSSVSWTGLKAYAINTPGQYAYGNVTLIAFKMKASQALSSSSDKISVQATRILPTIESDFTIKAPTTNVVDAFCHIVQEADPDGIDILAMKELSTRWLATNGFNFRFEDQITVFEALQVVSASHRAQPQAYASKLSMRPDEAKPFDQYLVTEEQILEDSYRCGINIGPINRNIDGFRVGYQDYDSTNTKYVTYPTVALTPQDVNLDGCTDTGTALAHSKYLYASKQTLRRVVTFDTEFDSLAFSVGDRISVMSNVVDNVQSMRVISQSGNVLTMDGNFTYPTLHLVVRDQYGRPSEKLTGSMSGNELTLDTLPPFPIFGAAANQENTTVVIGSMIEVRSSYTVNSIEPSSTSVTVRGSSYSDLPYLFPIPGEVLPT